MAGGFHSIAVLPFVNLAQNSDQDYVVDGMTDQLITSLASSTPLRVISRSSMMHYKGTQVPMGELARALNVDAVLEGSFLHNGKQVRITANLIDIRNDRHLWAQVYEESGDDLLSMQEPVTNDIVRQVAVALGSTASASKLRPVSVKARDLYLRGRFLWNKRTLENLNRSIEYYQEAIKADPEYAEAYAALGDAYVLLSSYGDVGLSGALAKAQEAAERALQLGGGLAEAHTVLGAVKTDRDWDWPGQRPSIAVPWSRILLIRLRATGTACIFPGWGEYRRPRSKFSGLAPWIPCRPSSAPTLRRLHTGPENPRRPWRVWKKFCRATRISPKLTR